MNTHQTSTANAAFTLVVLQGHDRGKKFDLLAGRKYLIGRSESCDIRIDMSDKTVSRQHARIEANHKQISLENLSATNPVLVKNKPIKSSTLKDKGQFRIGESLFAIQKRETAATPRSASGKSMPMLRIVLIAALVIICIGLGLIVMTDDRQTVIREPDMTMTTPSSDKLPPMQPPVAAKKPGDIGLSNLGLNVSAEDMKKADQHFRQGMFFYDTGNLSRAVDEWNHAVILYPDHPDAQTWFLRAEKELTEKVKAYYQNGMMHYKYMRYNDAAHEFRLVVELSRDKNSDQYLNALKTLNEIEGR